MRQGPSRTVARCMQQQDLETPEKIFKVGERQAKKKVFDRANLFGANCSCGAVHSEGTVAASSFSVVRTVQNHNTPSRTNRRAGTQDQAEAHW